MTTKRDQEFKKLYDAADRAGKEAADARVPVPMYVVERENPFDDNSAVKTAYPPVMGGVCGFAWVIVRPANSAFANYLRRIGVGRTDSYQGGLNIWVRDYGQSMEKKEAYAGAFANTLYAEGIKAYSYSRMD